MVGSNTKLGVRYALAASLIASAVNASGQSEGKAGGLVQRTLLVSWSLLLLSLHRFFVPLPHLTLDPSPDLHLHHELHLLNWKSPNTNGDRELIAGGSDLGSLTEYPWLVALNLEAPEFYDGNETVYCGASMISPIAAVSAAHCATVFEDGEGNIPPGTNAGDWHPLSSLVVGRYDLTTNDGLKIEMCQDPGTVIIPIPTGCEDKAVFFPHPNFDGTPPTGGSKPYLNNDFAIIIMPQVISSTLVPEFVKINRDAQKPAVAGNVPVDVLGWGRTEDTRPDPSNVARKTTIRTVSNPQCAALYAADSAILENKMCAGAIGGTPTVAGTCFLDSGTSLDVCAHRIASFGPTCGSQNEFSSRLSFSLSPHSGGPLLVNDECGEKLLLGMTSWGTREREF